MFEMKQIKLLQYKFNRFVATKNGILCLNNTFQGTAFISLFPSQKRLLEGGD